jgi:hypothetical protein
LNGADRVRHDGTPPNASSGQAPRCQAEVLAQEQHERMTNVATRTPRGSGDERQQCEAAVRAVDRRGWRGLHRRRPMSALPTAKDRTDADRGAR